MEGSISDLKLESCYIKYIGPQSLQLSAEPPCSKKIVNWKSWHLLMEYIHDSKGLFDFQVNYIILIYNNVTRHNITQWEAAESHLNKKSRNSTMNELHCSNLLTKNSKCEYDQWAHHRTLKRNHPRRTTCGHQHQQGIPT